MKKNLALMLGLASVVLLAGCGWEKVDNTDVENLDVNVSANEENGNDAAHPEWVATSLTVSDLERIEETMPPLSYAYETYDMQAQSIVNSGKYEVNEWEDPVFSIPEYEHMVSREVTNSWIEDDMIYTLTDITLDDGSKLQVLYVNEPDTLFCRAISVQNGDLSTLYSNFIYDADID